MATSTPSPGAPPPATRTIAVLGAPLPAAVWRALGRLGIREAPPDRAALRVVVGARPPAVAPAAAWLWCGDEGTPPADLAAAGARAVRAGACDVATPDGLAEVVAARLLELASPADEPPAPAGFVARSAAARRVVAELARAARTRMAVLLTGETGTGKEVAARYLHARSGRPGAFVPINCAAIPDELIEGELFGHARGAFSGAIGAYDGQLHAAAGGTVFLDEVDDTPPTLQAKLLRVLEDHVVSRLGENLWREVDFRVVAATNRDLAGLVARGAFGADLYQRLAIVRVELPPLRDRREDLPELVEHLLARYYREEPAAPHRVARAEPAALAALAAYPWPGNVRELRNVIFSSLVRKRGGDELRLVDLPAHVLAGAPEAEGGQAPGDAGADGGGVIDPGALARAVAAGRFDLRAAVEALERAALREALDRGGSAAGAARLLGTVGRGAARDPAGTVRAMMRRLGVTAGDRPGRPAR